MKNLNKVLAMLVVFMMVVSTVAFASTFSDVAETASYNTAIKVGTDLSFFTGYEDGTFKPEGEITRAEFAAIVVRMLGQEGQVEGAKATTMFTDVPADHWAAGYINIAVQAGVINGYGDGRFGPEDQVEYQDAITMIVRALGYEPAIGSAGYPTGYLTKAGELGLTSGVNGTNGVAINRGAVAQIVFNTLDVPLMTQTGYGTFTQYVVNDGYSSTTGETNVKKTILSQNHDIYKVQAEVVTSTDITSSSTTNTDKVTLLIKNAMNNKYSYTNTSVLRKGAQPTCEVGTTDAKKYVGKKVMAFIEYKEFENKYTIKSIYESAIDDTLTFDLNDLVSISGGTDADGNPVALAGSYKYYSSDDKTSTVKVDGDASIYVNGVNVNDVNTLNGIANFDADDLKEMSGTIELALLDTANTTADYDTVYITASSVFVVDENKTNITTIKNKVDTIRSIDYDETDGDVIATLVDANGADMDWEDLEEYDVLMIAAIKTTGSKYIYDAKIINNVVEGTVTSTSGTVGSDDRTVDIDGTEYDVAKVAEDEDEIKLQDSGKYYLDDQDNIVYFDTSSTLSGNYAYVIKTAVKDDSIGSANQIQILTKDNTNIVYDLAKTFKFDGTSGCKLEGDAIVKDSTTKYNDFADLTGTLITYKVNSSNQVTEIDLAANKSNVSKPEKEFTYEIPSTQVSGKAALTNYDPDDQTFGKYTLKDDVVIFKVVLDAAGDIDEDETEVIALPVLEEDDNLVDVVLYDVDDDDFVSAVVVYGDTSSLTADSDYATFITKVSKNYDEDGDEVYTVKGFKNNEEISYTVETTVDTDDLVGTIVVPQYKLSGEIKGFFDTTAGNTAVKGTEKFLTKKTLKSIDKYTLTFTDDTTLKLKSSTNVYVYDATGDIFNGKNKYKIDQGAKYLDYDSTNGIYINSDYTDLNVEVEYYTIDDDKVVDVVYYITDVTVNN